MPSTSGWFFSWGVLVFIVILGYILEYRFAQTRRQLEEYSLTLEQKVEERTQKLRQAQSQIVMHAKMASLGDLVAGVAHEMNNPIGVIASTADTANRGIRRIKSLIQKNRDLGTSSHDQQQLQQSLELLETNHQVIATASSRVANIVQSLWSFASLDEALIKQVDLHKNIDTTLTLIDYELRDKATVTKEYGEIPQIQCYPNELNQAFMDLLRNAASPSSSREPLLLRRIQTKRRYVYRSRILAGEFRPKTCPVYMPPASQPKAMG